jgi:hypothetical protein
LDDGAPDAGVPHSGDPVVALVDGHVVWVVVVELDACAGSEQEDEPGLVVLGQAAGCRVERVERVEGVLGPGPGGRCRSRSR